MTTREGGAVIKNQLFSKRRHKRCGFSPWVGKILRSRKWHPTPVFLPGKFHGQRSLAGSSPWAYKESDITERWDTHTQWNEWNSHQITTLSCLPSTHRSPLHKNSFMWNCRLERLDVGKQQPRDPLVAMPTSGEGVSMYLDENNQCGLIETWTLHSQVQRFRVSVDVNFGALSHHSWRSYLLVYGSTFVGERKAFGATWILEFLVVLASTHPRIVHRCVLKWFPLVKHSGILL